MNNVRTTGFFALGIAAAGLMLAPALSAENLFLGNFFTEKILCINSGAFGIIIQVTLLLISIFMMGWSIECFVNVRRAKLVPPEVIAQLQGYLEEGDFEGALQFCESAPNILTRTLGAALSRMQAGFDDMRGAVDQQLAVENGKLAAHIGPVSLCGAIGPMMGLFGTVSGMVGAFDEMAAQQDNFTPAMVAGNIGLALMSTVLGLVIAIPAIIIFWVLSVRVGRIIDEVGTVIDDMMETLRQYVQPAA